MDFCLFLLGICWVVKDCCRCCSVEWKWPKQRKEWTVSGMDGSNGIAAMGLIRWNQKFFRRGKKIFGKFVR